MSYILDALKKSEIERRAGDLSAVAAGSTYVVAPSVRTGRGGPMVIASAGMLAAGLVLGGWQPWASLPRAWNALAASVAPAPENAPVVPASATVHPVAPPAVVLQAAVPAPTPAVIQGHGETATQAAVLAPVQAPKPAPVKPAAKAAPAVEAKGAAKPAPQPASQTRAVAAPATGTQAQKAPLSRPDTPAAAASKPSNRIVAYDELPADIQASLPKVHFGGYAGVDEGDVRIAFINNRLVKEGEEISPGVRLENVSQAGVTLGYKGHHFRPAP